MVVDKKLSLDLYAKSRDIDCCARHVGKDGREKIWDTECVELVTAVISSYLPGTGLSQIVGRSKSSASEHLQFLVAEVSNQFSERNSALHRRILHRPSHLLVRASCSIAKFSLTFEILEYAETGGIANFR